MYRLNSPYLSVFAAAAAVLAASPAHAGFVPGDKVTDFIARAADGKPVRLSDNKGKTVVLEWHNPGCPFVQKHYDSGNMQTTQAKALEQGVVWLTVNSGAPGKQGYMSGEQALALVAGKNAQPTRYVLDPKGVVGRLYDAKTTPHMYIVDGEGVLRYQGAIDDKPTADPADIATSKNHVLAALGDMKAGRAVSLSESRPYGCSVKYAD